MWGGFHGHGGFLPDTCTPHRRLTIHKKLNSKSCNYRDSAHRVVLGLLIFLTPFAFCVLAVKYTDHAWPPIDAPPHAQRSQHRATLTSKSRNIRAPGPGYQHAFSVSTHQCIARDRGGHVNTPRRVDAPGGVSTRDTPGGVSTRRGSVNTQRRVKTRGRRANTPRRVDAHGTRTCQHTLVY